MGSPTRPAFKTPHECRNLVLLKSSFNPEKKYELVDWTGKAHVQWQMSEASVMLGGEDPREGSRGAASTARTVFPFRAVVLG